MAEPVSVPAAALELLGDWLPASDSGEFQLMTLSTADGSGMPDARFLLLSEWDATGFWFHTDSRSRKAEQLAANPAAALSAVWPAERRQLVVQGPVEPADAAELERAYDRRPPYLQQLAWQNTPEFAALAPEHRVAAWAEFQAAHPDGFAQPDTWAGYVVRPTRVTFWSGEPDTASHRLEFALVDGAWEERILAG